MMPHCESKKEVTINMKKVILFVLVLSIFSLLIVGCESYPTSQYAYKPPENINDGLDVGTLDEVNINSVLIEKAIDEINRGKYKEVHSLLIFKDNKLVLDGYFNGHKYQWDAPSHHAELVSWDRDMMHVCQSVTKSITATCVGIALNEGFIESVDQSVFDYLPEHQHLNTDGKDKITIEHLLTMTSGLEWMEWNAPYSSRENPIIEIWFQDAEHNKDPFTFFLEGELKDEPGTRFRYFGGHQILLGGIIENATQMNLDEFSAKYLFEPLGTDTFDWWIRYESGVIEAAGGIKMTPRDMMKVGVLYINKGVWNGKRVISEQWVEKSIKPFAGNKGIDVPGTDKKDVGYAYSWWTKTFSDSDKEIQMFYAAGWGGQNIFIFPELNAVVVTTGGTYTSTTKTFSLLEKYIIPAFN
jgi:CubicO group peptidase (beta-lactamase class C family)